jgi:endonuclease/exonuclease/phosphatase family metal-dependent hydrolase
MRTQKLTTVAVLIFTLQSLRVLFSTLFGFIYDQVFEGPITAWLGVSTGLALAALLAPALLGRRTTQWRSKTLALAAILARPLLSAPDVQLKFYGAVLVAAAGLSFLAVELAREPASWRAVLWALIGEQTLRLLGDTFDLSLQPGSLLWVVVLALALAFWIAFFQKPAAKEDAQPLRLPWTAGLALGGYLFLQVSLLSLPSAIARWSGVSYAPVALLTVLATAIPLFLPTRVVQIPRRSYLGLGVLLGVALLVGYFLQGAAAAGCLLLAQIVAGVTFSGMCQSREGDPGNAALPLAAGLSLFLVLNFMNAFAFTYPYTLPFMRGLGWLVYLVAGIALSGAGLATTRPVGVVPDSFTTMRARLVPLVVILLACIWSVRPMDVEPFPEGQALRFASWNIHYGYDDVWHTTLPEQMRAIKEAGVDVIALQEVDTGRMTSYSVDNAYYLGRRLGMQVAYLPAVEHLTGIAVLYKGAPAQVETRLLPSLQEQTGIIRVYLQTPGGETQAHGIWLGLSSEDTQAQMQSALDFIGQGTRATFAGDFNSHDGEPEVQAVLASGFADPFTLLGFDPIPPTDPAIEPEKRIDYVFVRDLVPTQAWVADSLASDHRMVVVELAYP